MKLGILNDTHLGISTNGQLKRCFRELAKENPDVVVHAGDYCGATQGHKTLRVTCELMRGAMPEVPILSVIGNHDRWCGHYPALFHFQENYQLILEAFKQNKIHFLDTQGIFYFDHVTILGASGWYNVKPDSNDWNFMPKWIEGDTHSYLQKLTNQILDRNLEQLEEKKLHEKRVFVSHFPVQDCNPWDWSPGIGKLLEQHYGFDYFVSGHSHGLKNGPKHFRTATDYGHRDPKSPHYLILEIP